MKVYLLKEHYGYSETSVLAVFRGKGRAEAMASIGKVAAQRDLEKHNKRLCEIGKPHWVTDYGLYKYSTQEAEVLS